MRRETVMAKGTDQVTSSVTGSVTDSMTGRITGKAMKRVPEEMTARAAGKEERTPGRPGIRCLAAVMMILVLCLTVLPGYSSLEERVFDGAELLSGEEEEQLQTEITDLAAELEMDIVIVTTADAGGKTAMAYADDFYDEGNFGYSTDGETGILLLIDMDNRECYISTAGDAIAAFTDRDVEDMLDDIVPWLSDGEYYQACAAFLQDVAYYGTNADTAQNGSYHPETNRFQEYTREELLENQRKAVWREAFSARSIASHLVISAVIGGVAVLLMVFSVRNQKAASGCAYIRPDSERLRERSDVKVNTTVVTRRIEQPHQNNGNHGSHGGGGFSSSHTSHGGASHGGGGRHF